MCMSSTLFSTKSKIQRVLYILLAILSLLSLGYAVYHYYPIYFSAKEMGTLHGTKYEFLERFYVKTEEGKDVYVIDGIIYNTNFDDESNVVFDMNAWDYKTKESFYYHHIDLPRQESEDPLEEIFPEFGAVSLQLYFEDKDLHSYSREKLTVGNSFLSNSLKRISQTVFSHPKLYEEFLVAKDVNGSLDFSSSTSRVVLLSPIYLSAMSSSRGIPARQDFELDQYVKKLDSRDQETLLSFGSTSCDIVSRIFVLNALNEEQKSVLINQYCNREELVKRLEFLHKADSLNKYRWDSLQDFVIDKKIDFNFNSVTPVEAIYALADLYAYAHLAKYTLTYDDLRVAQDNVARNILNGDFDRKNSQLPFSLWAALTYTVGQIGTDQYRRMFDELVDVAMRGEKDLLLKKLETDSIGIVALLGLSFSDNWEIKNLVNSSILKMSLFNIYSKNFDGDVYDGLWTKRDNVSYFSVIDNIRYLILLSQVYEN